MFTHKYRPKSLNGIVGYNSLVQRIRAWADEWEKGNVQKPLLLAGGPGIGKTSVAAGLANDYGWELLEMNSSDLRDKASIERIAGLASLSRTFSGSLRLILFDEIDGLYRADRGGASAVVNILKTARCPVILTANDAWDKRISALRAAVEMVEFRKVHYASIRNLLRGIADAEGIRVSDEALTEISRNANGDMRSATNDLENLSLGGELADDSLPLLGSRNRNQSIFDAIRIILKTMDYNESRAIPDTIAEDPQNLMAWIEENVPKEYSKPEDLHRAFECLSRADIFFGRTMSRQDYSLWRYALTLMTAGVSLSKDESYRGFTRYSFPQKISYLSRTKKRRDTMKAIASKVGGLCHTSTRTAIFDYMPVIGAMMLARPAETAAQLQLTEDEISYFGIKKPKPIMAEAQKIRDSMLMERAEKPKPSLANFS